jgi:Raf kinase inhibitor-like YbhB/YbcL family protein
MAGTTPRSAAPFRALLLTAIAVLVAACSPSLTSVASTVPSASSVVDASTDASAAASTSPSQIPEVTPMPSSGPSAAVKLSLTSSAFREGQPIAAKFSCHGADVSPQLAWSGVPAGAGALVLFVDDPDGRDWVHWTVLDLPARDAELPEGVSPTKDPPQQGRNDFGKTGYGGPCPPSGTHHYRFTLYALAKPLGLSGHPDGRAVRAALKGADVLAKVTLTGTYRA